MSLELRSERQRDLVVLGSLCLLLTAVYFDVIFLGNNFFTRDLTGYHYPMKKVVRDTVLAGNAPTWNAAFSGGQPMAANPAYEVFYPPQWLTFIPDYNLGFRLHILFHAYLAAIGAFLFLRSRGARASVAFIGGAALVLGGPFVSAFNLLPFMFSLAWTPWIALFAAKYFESRSRRDAILLMLFLGMQALICEPTTLLQTWFLLGLWGAWYGWNRAVMSSARSAARGFMEAVTLVVASLMVAAVQFLPAIDHARDSVRGEGFTWATLSHWSFPARRLLEFAYPNFMGSIEGGGSNYWAASLYPQGPYLFSVYVGLPIVALGVAGIILRKRGTAVVLASLVASIVLAMGSSTPILRILFDASLLPPIRYPEKFILMGALVMTAWGCLVFEDLLRGVRGLAIVTSVLLIATAAVAAGIFIWSSSYRYVEWFTTFWPGTGVREAAIARIHWLLAVLRGFAFAGAIELVRRSRTRAAVALLVLFVIADLGPLGNQVNPRMPRRFFDPPPAVDIVTRMSGSSRLLHLGWLDRRSSPFTSLLDGFDSYWVLRNGLVPAMPTVWGIPTILEQDIDQTRLRSTRDFMWVAVGYMRRETEGDPAWRSDAIRQIAGMCNVGVIATMREDLRLTGTRDVDWEALQPMSFEPVRAGPRYYFASEAVVVADRADMFNKLVERSWSPSVAFVDRPVPTAAGVVHSVDEAPNRVDLDVEAIGDGVLVAAVTKHKYWTATIDGQPAPVLAVNLAFQGVFVPAGRHLVSLRYQNPLLPTGGAVTLTMLVGFAVCLRKRRSA